MPLRGNIKTEMRAGASSVKELQEQTGRAAPLSFCTAWMLYPFSLSFIFSPLPLSPPSLLLAVKSISPPCSHLILLPGMTMPPGARRPPSPLARCLLAFEILVSSLSASVAFFSFRPRRRRGTSSAKPPKWDCTNSAR